MRRRFFTDKFENNSAFLRGEAAHHLARVLRAEPGQIYELSDGMRVRLGRIVRATPDEVEFALDEIGLSQDIASETIRLESTLLISIVKFDRFEWALEKATELGVGAIVPLSAGRSEKALVKAASKRAARWERILVESAQQSRRLRPPALNPISSPEKAFRLSTIQEGSSGARILLSERLEAPPLREVLSKLVTAFSREVPRTAALAIGPEGGWTSDEFAAAAAAGFAEASLGRRILRTETAVTAAIASLNYALGD